MKLSIYYCDLCGKKTESSDLHFLTTYLGGLQESYFEVCSDCLEKLREKKNEVCNSVSRKQNT